MKKVISYSLSDVADVIKDKTAQGRKSLVFGRKVAYAVHRSSFLITLLPSSPPP